MHRSPELGSAPAASAPEPELWEPELWELVWELVLSYTKLRHNLCRHSRRCCTTNPRRRLRMCYPNNTVHLLAVWAPVLWEPALWELVLWERVWERVWELGLIRTIPHHNRSKHSRFRRTTLSKHNCLCNQNHSNTVAAPAPVLAAGSVASVAVLASVAALVSERRAAP